jgi:small subunit ribosomal protein S7
LAENEDKKEKVVPPPPKEEEKKEEPPKKEDKKPKEMLPPPKEEEKPKEELPKTEDKQPEDLPPPPKDEEKSKEAPPKTEDKKPEELPLPSKEEEKSKEAPPITEDKTQEDLPLPKTASDITQKKVPEKKEEPPVVEKEEKKVEEDKGGDEKKEPSKAKPEKFTPTDKIPKDEDTKPKEKKEGEKKEPSKAKPEKLTPTDKTQKGKDTKPKEKKGGEKKEDEGKPKKTQPKSQDKKDELYLRFSPLIFGKYDLSEVVVEDPGLRRYINLSPVGLPHTGAKHANKSFGKTKVNVVERLINNMMRTEHTTGKKAFTYRTVSKSFDIIHKRTKTNPVQVFIYALQNSSPKEEITRLRFGGISVPKAVDTSSAHRLDVALRNICKGAVSSSHRNKKRMEVCLAEEIILASKADMNSFAISKKEEMERIAASAR